MTCLVNYTRAFSYLTCWNSFTDSELAQGHGYINLTDVLLCSTSLSTRISDKLNDVQPVVLGSGPSLQVPIIADWKGSKSTQITGACWIASYCIMLKSNHRDGLNHGLSGGNLGDILFAMCFLERAPEPCNRKYG